MLPCASALSASSAEANPPSAVASSDSRKSAVSRAILWDWSACADSLAEAIVLPMLDFLTRRFR